jgi:hypothetical protein
MKTTYEIADRAVNLAFATYCSAADTDRAACDRSTAAFDAVTAARQALSAAIAEHDAAVDAATRSFTVRQAAFDAWDAAAISRSGTNTYFSA